MRPKIFLVGLTFLVFAVIARAEEPKAPFILSIVPSHSGKTERSIMLDKDQSSVFYVVIKNVSDRPQSVWETWCSWGYEAVSFELTFPDGNLCRFSRRTADLSHSV